MTQRELYIRDAYKALGFQLDENVTVGISFYKDNYEVVVQFDSWETAEENLRILATIDVDVLHAYCNMFLEKIDAIDFITELENIIENHQRGMITIDEVKQEIRRRV